VRCLLTGATGFLGSCVLRRLLQGTGTEVAILMRPSSNPWRIEELLPRVKILRGDLLSLSDVADEVRRFAPDTVLHLAWYGVGGRHRNDPQQVARNVESSSELLQLAARSGCRTYVALGSQAEYGPQNRMLDESAPTRPTTTYGAAKLRTFLRSRELAQQANIRFAWVRLFSTYGPKDNPDWMLPSLIRSLCRGERPALTAGEQRWDYLYVEDAAEAICGVAETPDASGVFNLGSGHVETVRRVAETVRDLIDPSLPLGFGEVPYRPDQVMHLQADVSRLCSVTGWTPRTALAEGLARTVDWYRAHGGNA